MTIGRSGSGIGFDYSEVGGNRKVEPIWTADCRQSVLARDSPIVEPLDKSGAIDDDFSRTFLSGPAVHLPAGQWDITALVSFVDAPDCSGREHSLQATVRIRVVP